MENNNEVKKRKSLIVMILTIVILLLLGVCICLGVIISKNDKIYDCNCLDNPVIDDKQSDKVDDYLNDLVDNGKDNYEVKINILNMDEPSITVDSPNHHLYITGDMNISFEEENFYVVGLEGYCLGEENEKYMIYGPASEGGMSFKNGDTRYELVETIGDEDGDVIYPDGTKKNSNDIDWENVKIKSCKIEKLYTVYNINGKSATGYTDLDYEKVFN